VEKKSVERFIETKQKFGATARAWALSWN